MLKHWTTADLFPLYTPPSLCRIADGDFDIEAQVDKITALLDDAPQGGGGAGGEEDPPVAGQSTGEDEDDGAPLDEEPSAEDEGEAEPALPPIEPPLSWSKEHKQHWHGLPRETQEYLHSREQERDAAVRRSQNESAELRRTLDADKAALAQERQRAAEQLSAYVALAETLDPILAEGRKADWAKMAQEDPATTQRQWFLYQQRQAQVADAVRERDHLLAAQMQEHLAREGLALVEKVPEWANDLDAARTGIDTLRKGAVERYGYQPAEVAVIRDHRVALMLKDALAYHALQAEVAQRQERAKVVQKTAQQKRAAAPAPRLAASAGTGTNAGSRPDRSAMRNRAMDPHASMDDRVDAILAQI